MAALQYFYMFDKQKMKELQQRSHNRGLLSKEFYNNEQQQLERKRREMKAELDRQVEERRRKKEQEKMQNQRRIRKEEEQIKNYYRHLENRDKRTSANESSALQASSMKQANQPYQTYPVEMQNESRQKGISLNKAKGQSKPILFNEGDIPLMPLLPLEYASAGKEPQTLQQGSVLAMSKQSMQNIGNIPLLSLSQDSNPVISKVKKSKQKTTKREKTLETVKESQEKGQQSRQVANAPSLNFREERRSTIPDEQSIFGSIVHANNIQKPVDNGQIPEELNEVEQQNKSLKMELKKQQEALSLLIGAVRSNGKMDKYRVQAERILHGSESTVRRQEQKEEERGTMLPKIYMRHQSIMHDYLLSAARRSKKGSQM